MVSFQNTWGRKVYTRSLSSDTRTVKSVGVLLLSVVNMLDVASKLDGG